MAPHFVNWTKYINSTGEQRKFYAFLFKMLNAFTIIVIVGFVLIIIIKLLIK